MSDEPVITPPSLLGLPGPEHGPTPVSTTRALVTERWPVVEALLAHGRTAEAVGALEALASAMREAASSDDDRHQPDLTLARRIVYDDLSVIGRTAGRAALAREALLRCAAWDEELRDHLEDLVRRT